VKHIIVCHSGLSGIFLCFQKDFRRVSLAGMTAFEVFNCRGNSLYKFGLCAIINDEGSSMLFFGLAPLTNRHLEGKPL
jgi:hypothetical protein